MNILDLIILIPLAWSAYKGFSKGLIISVASLLALLLGIYGSIRFSDITSGYLIDHFEFSSQYLPIISFAITFILIAVTLTACVSTTNEPAVSNDPTDQIVQSLEATIEALVEEVEEAAAEEAEEIVEVSENIEIVEVLNIITPVAVYLTAAFEQYADKFGEITHEEWEDTQHQLTSGSTLYGDCVKRLEAGEYDRQLFLDLEESWQIFVKVGVAGLRTKSMLEADLKRSN